MGAKANGEALPPLFARANGADQTAMFNWCLIFAIIVGILGVHMLYGFRINLYGGSARSLYHRFQPRFAGEYGEKALVRLEKWLDDLFAATMTMYKGEAQRVCKDRNMTVDCSEAKKRNRPPEPHGHARYNLFSPYMTCPAGKDGLNRIGNDGEGGKMICTELLMGKEDCVVFSLGSNGQFDFEKSILESTNCTVYTFDCTYDGSDIGPRHQYHKKCIGDEKKAGSNPSFTTLSKAVKDLNIVQGIKLLKIDIEGFEVDEIASWQVSNGDLPEQIAIELHHSQVMYNSLNDAFDFSNLVWPLQDLILSDLSLLFGHLARLGYSIVSREDNPIGACCSEFLLLKVADWNTKV